MFRQHEQQRGVLRLGLLGEGRKSGSQFRERNSLLPSTTSTSTSTLLLLPSLGCDTQDLTVFECFLERTEAEQTHTEDLKLHFLCLLSAWQPAAQTV